MTSDREGLIGKAPLPTDENIEQGTLDEDLLAPEEKRNATDGYAPADDGFEPTDAKDDVERLRD